MSEKQEHEEPPNMKWVTATCCSCKHSEHKVNLGKAIHCKKYNFDPGILARCDSWVSKYGECGVYGPTKPGLSDELSWAIILGLVIIETFILVYLFTAWGIV